MNYIKQLQAKVEHLESERDTLRSDIKDFLSFLGTSRKFQGEDLDGSRKDWISTGDAITRLQNILFGK